ncbi:unnamed protein product [Alopecurus aequalis]
MPRPRHSRESKKKEKWEWERTLARNPNWGWSGSETPLPSPWAEFPIPAPASSLPTPRLYSDGREVPSAISSPEGSSSASRGTGPHQKAVRVQHSAMYLDRPRRSRRNRGGPAQQSTSSPVEEQDAGKGSSNEPGPTISDTSKFEMLSLNDSPPALDSSDGAVVRAGDMGTGLPDSTDMTPAAPEESMSPRSEAQREADCLSDPPTPTFDSMEDAFEYFWNSEKAAEAARDKARSLSWQASLEKYEAQQLLISDQAQPVPAQESSAVAAQGQYEGSKEKIAENGKKWMSEEVRVAFQKYFEKQDNLKDHEYEFDELQHQCFHVENYCKIFHHFNFTVKLKEPGSSEWTSTLYFAEVKEILRRTIYFCSPLEPYENGNCYACKNQRMDDLKHPVIGAFDRGSPDTVFPYMYGSDSSSDDNDGPVYDEAGRTRRRAAGVRAG